MIKDIRSTLTSAQTELQQGQHANADGLAILEKYSGLDTARTDTETRAATLGNTILEQLTQVQYDLLELRIILEKGREQSSELTGMAKNTAALFGDGAAKNASTARDFIQDATGEANNAATLPLEKTEAAAHASQGLVTTETAITDRFATAVAGLGETITRVQNVALGVAGITRSVQQIRNPQQPGTTSQYLHTIAAHENARDADMAFKEGVTTLQTQIEKL